MNIDRNLRTRTRLLLAVPVVAAAFSLAACSGSAGSDRPSEGELSSGIQKILDEGGIGEQFTGEQVDCISDELLDSKISDQDLQNLADGKDVQTSQDAKDLVSKEMATAVQSCGVGQ